MTTEERRQELLQLLTRADGARTGTELAKKLGVSRQIIVGDVSILRAEGAKILSTPRGYRMLEKNPGVIETVTCRHTAEEMGAELDAMVDNGVTVRDVIVEHPVYGEIRADLMLESRRDVAAFVRKMAAAGAPPLSQLTDGIHLHTVEAKTREEIEDARNELARLGFLALEKMESDA